MGHVPEIQNQDSENGFPPAGELGYRKRADFHTHTHELKASLPGWNPENERNAVRTPN